MAKRHKCSMPKLKSKSRSRIQKSSWTRQESIAMMALGASVVMREEYDTLVTCGDCNNRWDGFAQCSCYMDNY
jgi:hypothetical protein